MPKIIVNEKVLAHLSRGLYRSPASTIRELVSNAWDANATHVHISTGAPNFLMLSVKDNGDGFSKEDFERLMGGGIGSSLKKPKESNLKFGRPTIGKLGIGMLGIAQICGSFRVRSKMADGTSFSAIVRLFDDLRSKVDENDPQIIHQITEPSISDEDEPPVERTDVMVGHYDFEDIDSDELDFGTYIFTEDVLQTFTRTFRDDIKSEGYHGPLLEWKKNIERAGKYNSLQELGDYWKLLWELSASCPIPYIDASALPKRLIRDEQKVLESYNFAVFVDGIQLFKPVYLKQNEHGYTTLSIPKQTKRVFGKDLEFEGYIAVQEGSQIRPDELRGLLLRVRNVGIGYYDQTFMDYRINQGPRSRWVTGEIYIRKGMEDALNIDRDSFNKFHPEYKVVQSYIHGVLKEDVFSEVYRKLAIRSDDRAKSRDASRDTALKATLESVMGKKVAIKHRKSAEAPVSLDSQEDKLTIELAPLDMIETKKSHRHLAEAILTIFAVADAEPNAIRRRERFSNLLLKLLKGW
jgi:hypothetical protein